VSFRRSTIFLYHTFRKDTCDQQEPVKSGCRFNLRSRRIASIPKTHLRPEKVSAKGSRCD